MSVLNGKKIDGDHRPPEIPPAGRIELVSNLVPPRYFRWKAVLGRVLAAILLIPGAPIIGLLVLLVRLSSRGPGIYRQVRVGKGGETFTLYKIRTMRHDAEAGIGVIWARENDDRRTRVGKVLRKLHLDEFPQLLNVVKGEMALIGPRPERPEFVHWLAEEIPAYADRLVVLPGITGLAQINLPPDRDLDSVRNKLALDLEYIRQAGILLDLRMFLCTGVRLLGLPGVFAMHFFRLARDVTSLDGQSLRTRKSTPVAMPRQVLPAIPSGNGRKLLNAFTVDVEDYFQVTGFEKDIRRDQWGHWDSRVMENTHRVLKLLDRHQVRATFFILGWIARRYPQLVREIHTCGHEIGSHSYWHRLIYEQSPEEFRSDLQQTRDVLMDAIGERVVAHRAPSFSITKDSLWALQILAEEGFLIDTSIYPTFHDRYGIPDAEPRIHQITTPAGPLWEFPPSIAKFARINIPVSGGGYFRLYPLQLTFHLLSRVNQKHARPFMFYVHPWELDPDQPRIQVGSRTSRARHYLNLASTERRLELLLRRFRFGTMSEVIREAQTSAATQGNGETLACLLDSTESVRPAADLSAAPAPEPEPDKAV